LLQKKQRNVFQSSVPEHSSWHQFCFHALNRRWSDTQTGVSISLTHTRSALNNSHISESTAQVEFYARGFSVHVWSTAYLCMYVRTYVQGDSDEIQTPTHQSFTGNIMTAPPSVLSPSSILPSPSLTAPLSPQEKFRLVCMFNIKLRQENNGFCKKAQGKKRKSGKFGEKRDKITTGSYLYSPSASGISPALRGFF